MLSWNDYVEERFHGNDIDLSTNDLGPHMLLDLSEESYKSALKTLKENNINIFKNTQVTSRTKQNELEK